MKFYKISMFGVSQFVPTEDIKTLSRLKRNFGGKIVVDESGNPIVFGPEDILNIQRGNSGIGNTVDQADVKAIFGDDSTVNLAY